MRRGLKWAAPFVGIAILGVAILWVLAQSPGISRGNVERIARGATEPEVELLLGTPAGIHTSDGENWVIGVPVPPRVSRKLWIGDDGAACVDFNPAGQVITASWIPRRQGLRSMIRNALGL
jgi:hypothetical protein